MPKCSNSGAYNADAPGYYDEAADYSVAVVIGEPEPKSTVEIVPEPDVSVEHTEPVTEPVAAVTVPVVDVVPTVNPQFVTLPKFN